MGKGPGGRTAVAASAKYRSEEAKRRKANRKRKQGVSLLRLMNPRIFG